MGILEVVLTDEEREQIRQEEADERAMEKAMPLAMEKANIKLAQKLKQAGMPVHEIAEYMELELKQVEAL